MSAAWRGCAEPGASRQEDPVPVVLPRGRAWAGCALPAHAACAPASAGHRERIVPLVAHSPRHSLRPLLDEHANIAALDPAKLPAIRQQIWTLMRAAKMDHDLGLEERPEEDVFDDMLLHVDGWLCEIKDVQIRDGLHVLGRRPEGEAELDLVLAMDDANLADLGGRTDRVRKFRDLDPVEPGSDVPDPYYGGEDGFEEVLAMVERTASALVDALQRERPWEPAPR